MTCPTPSILCNLQVQGQQFTTVKTISTSNPTIARTLAKACPARFVNVSFGRRLLFFTSSSLVHPPTFPWHRHPQYRHRLGPNQRGKLWCLVVVLWVISVNIMSAMGSGSTFLPRLLSLLEGFKWFWIFSFLWLYDTILISLLVCISRSPLLLQWIQPMMMMMLRT